jgi:transcriptional regulator with XRE-family HTH domain
MPKRLGRPAGLTPDGPEIKRLRVGLGLTAAQLAPRAGFRHPKSLMAVESACRPISPVTASRLARALGVEVEDILSDGESEPETDRLSA